MTTATRAPRVETTMPKGRGARAAMLLAIYLGLGENRTLERASEIARSVGVRISPSTLFAYSKDYHFVERAAEHDGERMQAVQRIALEDAIASDVEQMELARLLTGYGATVIKSHMTDLEGKPKPRLDTESAGDGIRAADVGFKMMRLVNGQSTEIHASLHAFHVFVANTVGAIWQEALARADAHLAAHGVPDDVRKDAIIAAKAYYGPEADRAVTEHYRAMGMDVGLLGPGAAGPAAVIEGEARDA